MMWSRLFKGLALFIVLVTLHYTVRPLLAWRAGIDFLAIAMLLLAVRVRPGMAAVLGFVVGIVSDSLAPASFGAGALGFTVISFAASWLKAVFFADNMLLHAFFFFAGKWAYDIIHVLAEHQAGVSDTLMQLFVWAPISAALTAVVGLIVVVVFRATLEPQSS